MGPKPPPPIAPPSTGRKPPRALGIRRRWREGNERFPGRSGPGSNASCAAIAARTTGRRRVCRGPSRSWRSTGRGPRRCRTCGRASCAGRAGLTESRPRASPGWNRATPTPQLSPVSATRYRASGPSRAFIHPPPRPGDWASQRPPHARPPPRRHARGVRRPCPSNDEGSRHGCPRRRRPSGLDHPRLRLPEGRSQTTPGGAGDSMGRNPQLAAISSCGPRRSCA
jgi:hypothetical protein